MNRRSFLAALAALPVIGKVLAQEPEPEWTEAMDDALIRTSDVEYALTVEDGVMIGHPRRVLVKVDDEGGAWVDWA